MALLGNGDVLKEILSEIKGLREDVQRASIITGLLARPGSLSSQEIVAAAEKFAEEQGS